MIQREEEEREFKKRKYLLKHNFTLEILLEIAKYFNDPKDYIYLAQTSKYFYEIMLLKDNYLFNYFNDILFENIELKLTNNLPDYLFKLKKLHLNSNDNDYNLLQKFTNVITLLTGCFFGNFLQYLPNLEELLVDDIYNVNENSFTNLKQLKVLSILNNNQLKDEWLKNFNYLTKLEICNNENNNITGSCLQYFKNLKSLQLLKCLKINDELLLNCKQLETLIIPGCNNIFGNCFKELKELKNLDISYCNNIKDNCLNNLNNLKLLKIKNCDNITGNCLQNLQQLQVLNITVKNTIQLKYFQNLINLKELHININIDDEVNNNTSFLTKLINLKYLFLELFNTNSRFIFRDEDFYNLTNLKDLTISTYYNEINTEFTGKCFKYFTKLNSLSCSIKLKLENFKYLPNIKHLDLTLLNEPICFKEFSCLKQLEKLELKDTIKLNLNDLKLFTNLKHIKIISSTINGEFENLPNLTTLDLRNLEIQDKQIMNLENLTTLVISHSGSINGECFLNLKRLQVLQICYCKTFNFKFISNLKQLTQLVIIKSTIKEEDLEGLNNLQFLSFSYCPNINLSTGTFLLNMNKLNHLECDAKNILNKTEMEMLNNEIKKGNNFKQSINNVLNINNDQENNIEVFNFSLI
ncbi:hypothetical protein ABK040_002531 [Willaertia magna]